MDAVELDRQGIERRDFPIVRRGYDPASVDAHLRALSAEVEELRREAEHRGQESLASVAGTQVQGILEAAQATAETIEREAAQDAGRVRAAADADARRTREEAIARARGYVAAVSQATEVLLARVGSIDGETRTLVESLRAGAGRLAGDLTTVEAEMEALYDAAAGRAASDGDSGGEAGGPIPGAAGGEAPGTAGGGARGTAGGEAVEETDPASNGVSQIPSALAPAEAFVGSHVEPEVESAAQSYMDAATEPGPLTEEPPAREELPFADKAPSGPAPGGDLDGARLVALNMALNGDSRQDTGRYLAENFQIAEPERLLDEVYAVIEG
jgi:DivIVA domain-containing protein